MPLIQGDKGDYIIIRGRSGIEYYDEYGLGFSIDGEMVSNDEYDFAIYPESIEYIDSDKKVADEIKKSIKNRLTKMCLNGNIKVRFF